MEDIENISAPQSIGTKLPIVDPRNNPTHIKDFESINGN